MCPADPWNSGPCQAEGGIILHARTPDLALDGLPHAHALEVGGGGFGRGFMLLNLPAHTKTHLKRARASAVAAEDFGNFRCAYDLAPLARAVLGDWTKLLGS